MKVPFVGMSLDEAIDLGASLADLLDALAISSLWHDGRLSCSARAAKLEDVTYHVDEPGHRRRARLAVVRDVRTRPVVCSPMTATARPRGLTPHADRGIWVVDLQ